LPGRQLVPADAARDDRPALAGTRRVGGFFAAVVPGGGPGARGRVPAMHDVSEPADPGRGDRAVMGNGEWGMGNDLTTRTSEVRRAPAAPAPSSIPHSPFPIPHSATPLLLFEQVSKRYGPVIGVNQVTLELRGGITGLVGANG